VITGGTASCDDLETGMFCLYFGTGVLIFGLGSCNEHHIITTQASKRKSSHGKLLPRIQLVGVLKT
jgi:hypothetical protein